MIRTILRLWRTLLLRRCCRCSGPGSRVKSWRCCSATPRWSGPQKTSPGGQAILGTRWQTSSAGLESADLVTVRMIGRSKLVQANAGNPYFEPLARLALMSFGPPYVIRQEFGALGNVEGLFIYGSWAARYAGEQGPAPRDVDVLLIGEPDRDAVYEATRRAEERLGHEVNVTIRDAERWKNAADGFTRQLRSSPLVEIPLDGSGA